MNHSGEITARQPGVHQPFLPLFFSQQQLHSHDGGTVVPACQWAPPEERQEGVSTQGCREANPAAGLQCLPSFTREHIWIRVLQVHLSTISFFQSFTVIPPLIQTICRVCCHKRAEAQSRHPEERPQVGEDHTVGKDVVLAAALGLMAHRPWHQVQGCRAWFVVTAVYGQVPPMPAKLGCVSTVIPLPIRSQMVSPQGHKINNNGRKSGWDSQCC